jgi:hypothetical protein
LQIDVFRQQGNAALDGRDRVVDPARLGKLAGEFLNGRRKWRPPRRGPAQLFDRFFAASGAAECRAKQGFEPGIVAAADDFFQRRDGFVATVLCDQRLGEQRHGGRVGPARAQHFSGKPLGLGEMAIRSASVPRSSACAPGCCCLGLKGGRCFATRLP